MSRITVDLAKECGKIKPMHAVNNGPAGSRVRQSSSTFKYFEEAKIPYARTHDAAFYSGYGGEFTVDVHNIFRNFDADENLAESYDFEMTDQYLKDIESVGTKTFYRLGSKIEHGKKYGTYPPKDFAKWARICEHIIRHYTEGWADGFFMDIEYWEIWNEPDCKNADGTNPCWQGTDKQFIELFVTAFKHLKTCFPKLKIGGPAFCGAWNDRYNALLFDALKEENLTIDFFSFHGYANKPDEYADAGHHAYELLKKYGCEDKTELILNEWNYIRGWLGEDWEYSLRSEKGLKGSSFIAGTMSVAQKSEIYMMMYYDARPCGMNGMFATEGLYALKGYYPFLMFSKLYEMGKNIPIECDDGEFYGVSAKADGKSGIMVTYYNDDDTKEPKEVAVEFKNLAKTVRADFYLLDENNDMRLVRSEKTEAKDYTAYLNMTLFSTYYIELTELD